MKPFIPTRLPELALDWNSLVPLIGRSNRALAHYGGVLCGVPNAELLLSPLTTQEAILSARIEGTQASLSEVLKYEAGVRPTEFTKEMDIKEILNYRNALNEAEKSLSERPFSLNLVRRLHEILLDSVRGNRLGRGEFRLIQNWIGKEGTPLDKADFVPPPPLLLQGFLDDWEEYYHSDQPDPLVQLAIIHAQFEILHPFRDGNGRIGRILIPLFLFEKKLLSHPTFYLSEWLEENREEYIHSLRQIGKKENAWQQWTAFFLIAIEKQAQLNANKATAIMGLYGKLKAQIIELTHSQFAVPLLDHLFQRPVFQTSDLDLKPAPSRPMIANLVRTLHESGIIKAVRESSGRRAAIYGVRELINTCEGRNVI